MLISGGVFSAMFGMASVWGTLSLLSVGQIALFTTFLYVGGLVLQYPVGWISDRMDRRTITLWLSVVGAAGAGGGDGLSAALLGALGVAAILGGVTYPMYSLLIAYTNDFLSKEQMAAASAGLIFLNGMGAIFGPLVVGWLMGVVGTRGFFLYMGMLYAVQAAYTVWRMSRRAAPTVTGAYRGVTPTPRPWRPWRCWKARPIWGPRPKRRNADGCAGACACQGGGQEVRACPTLSKCWISGWARSAPKAGMPARERSTMPARCALAIWWRRRATAGWSIGSTAPARRWPI
jgi:MFS family permease